MLILNKIKALRFKYFIFGNLLKPIKRNKINLFYWEYMLSQNNVGDYLSKILYELIVKDLNLNTKRYIETKKIAIIGSILQILHKGTVVWGSGSLTDYLNTNGNSDFLDIRAVRGPLTKKLLDRKNINCPTVYGDPAILLPLFYNPPLEKKNPYLIIPHHASIDFYKQQGEKNIAETLTNDWIGFINQIIASEFVISSSLHGIILAESYSIPAIFLDDGRVENIFKYMDYYASTNRLTFKRAKTVKEALSIGPNILPDNLDSLRMGLLKSFPFDLFEDDNIKSIFDIKDGAISQFISRIEE